MYRIYLKTTNRTHYRGEYETLETALKYGQKDYNDYYNLLTMLNKSNNAGKMVIVNGHNVEVHTFNYSVHTEV